MENFLGTLGYAFGVTGPILVVLALGLVLNRTGLINDNFIDSGSRLVFNVALPSLLFISISQTRIEQAASLRLIGVGVVGTLLMFVVLDKVSRRWVLPAEERGVVVQGGFRSNLGVIGLAYCANAYGNDGLVAASLYLALVTVLFNVLSVVTLSRWLNREAGIAGTLKGIAGNPLILGILLALPVSWYQVELPPLLIRTGEYFAQMTLPLALLCTGASLNFGALRLSLGSALLASGFKLLLVPATLTLAGILVGLRGLELGVLLLMACAPTAAASYVMVRAMGGNAALAANIIVITTVGSLFFTSAAVTVLKAAGLT